MEDEIVVRDRVELDFLLVNLESSVKIKRRSDFFSWVQGVFQSMVSHDALICAVAQPGGRGYLTEWLGAYPLDEARFSELCQPDGGLLHSLMAVWEQTGRRPVMLASGAGSAAAGGLSAELARYELDNVIAHGLPGLDGQAASFFAFFKVLGGLKDSHARMIELLVPYLHAAWMRVCCESRLGQTKVTVTRDILTTREVEILHWVERGKSNAEIAQILDISHLTVKNHVQKILRKLNAQNRTQAVAKGIAMNITRHLGYAALPAP